MKTMLIAAMLLASSAALSAETAASVRKEIDAANQKWSDGVAKGDAAAMAALYTEDAVALPPGMPEQHGRAAIQATFEGLIKMGIKQIKLTTLELTVRQDIAIERGGYQVGSGPAAQEGKSMVIWKKVGGKWLFYRDMWNDSAPAPAAKP